jgi:hypothetical protein
MTMDAHAATPQPNPAPGPTPNPGIGSGRPRLPFGRPGPRLVLSWLIIATSLLLVLGVYSGILGG